MLRAPPIVVAMTGLPATGKSTIAVAVAKRLEIPVLSADPLEAALHRVGVTRELGSDRAVYEVLQTLVETQLALEQSAIVDAVNQFEHLRRMWREVAERCGGVAVTIECVCSSDAIHERRLAERNRSIRGFLYEPSWPDVLERIGRYESALEPDLVLDCTKGLDENRGLAVACVIQKHAELASVLRSGVAR